MAFLSSPDNSLFFFDEGRFGLQPNLGRCWTLRKVRRHCKVKPGYKNFYLYSSISPISGEHFTLLLPWVNTEIMNLYLEYLSSAFKDKQLMLIMDQAGWHRSKNLQKPENIKFVYLPPYSPELNPVERLWAWLRRHTCRNRMFESVSALKDTLCDSIKYLTKTDYTRLCNCSYL
jgi:transposase